MSLFLDSQLIYMSILMSIPHGLNYFVDFKSGGMSFPTLFSFFKIFFFFFCYSRSLEFPYELQYCVGNFWEKKVAMVLIGIMLKAVNQFGEHFHLKTVFQSMNISLHLFRHLKTSLSNVQQFSIYMSCTSFVKLTPKDFILVNRVGLIDRFQQQRAIKNYGAKVLNEVSTWIE